MNTKKLVLAVLILAVFGIVSSALGREYQIVKGDTLSEISKREEISIAEIGMLNPSIKGDRIYAGKFLILPDSKDVPKGEFFSYVDSALSASVVTWPTEAVGSTMREKRLEDENSRLKNELEAKDVLISELMARVSALEEKRLPEKKPELEKETRAGVFSITVASAAEKPEKMILEKTSSSRIAFDEEEWRRGQIAPILAVFLLGVFLLGIASRYRKTFHKKFRRHSSFARRDAAVDVKSFTGEYPEDPPSLEVGIFSEISNNSNNSNDEEERRKTDIFFERFLKATS